VPWDPPVLVTPPDARLPPLAFVPPVDPADPPIPPFGLAPPTLPSALGVVEPPEQAPPSIALPTRTNRAIFWEKSVCITPRVASKISEVCGPTQSDVFGASPNTVLLLNAVRLRNPFCVQIDVMPRGVPADTGPYRGRVDFRNNSRKLKTIQFGVFLHSPQRLMSGRTIARPNRASSARVGAR